MKNIIIALIFFTPFICKCQDLEKWDSAYLKHWVDSSGTLPPNVDLSTLHLETSALNLNEFADMRTLAEKLLLKCIDLQRKINYLEENEKILVQTISIYKRIVELMEGKP